MLHRVVRPFPCSFNGLTLVDLDAGDERDFGNMASGLIDAGYIEEISASPTHVVVESAAMPVAAYETKPASRRGRRGQ